MTRWNGKHDWLLAFVLPLLAATLACNALSGPAGPGPANGLLTQAAATITAAAKLEATAQAAAPTSATSPTQAPTVAVATAASSPAAVPSATTAPTQAAVTATPETAASGTPAATAANAAVVDPCRLITVDEAQAFVGVSVGTPQQKGAGCLFLDAATGFTYEVIVYALPASQSQSYVQQSVAQLKSFNVKVDPAAETKLNQDVTANDTVAAVNDLIGMSVGQANYTAQKLDGLGSTALWAWNKYAKLQQASLTTAKPGVVVALLVVVGLSAKEADLQPAMQKTVSHILDGLPASFTVAGLQVAGSAPAIDLCALASASEIEAVMGAQPGRGQAVQGQCYYLAASNLKIQLRVYALPGGQAATEALNQVEANVIAGNAKAQVDADIKAGDLVAAVKDLAATGPSLFGKPEAVDGLGDASMFVLAAPGGGTIRIGYLLAAKPGVLVGLTMILGPGDNATTKAAAIALLSHILSTLPAKFTVSGLP